MNKKTLTVEEVVEAVPAGARINYYRIARTEGNLVFLETVTVIGDTVVASSHGEATYMPIAVDKFKRIVHDEYFNAVNR